MKVQRVCQNPQCKKEFKARSADVQRGWARFCSKRCKAVEQEGRTGQYATLLKGNVSLHDAAMMDATAGWDEDGWRGDDSGVSKW